jgi:hypothetical protein
MPLKYYLCCNCGNELEADELPEQCDYCATGKEDLMEQTDGFFYGDGEFDDIDSEEFDEE